MSLSRRRCHRFVHQRRLRGGLGQHQAHPRQSRMVGPGHCRRSGAARHLSDTGALQLRLTRTHSPFRVAYLVLSHHRPEQVEALAERILDLSPAGQVVVHHDASAPMAPWNGSPPPRVHLLPRTRVLWGDWSMVETSLRLLRFASEELDADWCSFLSGEDRPVVNLARWERAVAST